MRIGNYLFDQFVTRLRIGAAGAVTQCLGLNAFHVGREIAFLFMEERLAIGNQELSIANLGAVNRRIINLGKNAARQGKPYPAGGGIGSANAVFGACRPCRRDSRMTKGRLHGLTIAVSPKKVSCAQRELREFTGIELIVPGTAFD